MPVERHIFLAQLTGVTDESEVERVLVRTCEPVNAFALAALRVYSARPHDCYRVAREGARAPYIPSRLPSLSKSTSKVPSALIIQTVPSEFVHVPTRAACPDFGKVAQAPGSAKTRPAKTIRREVSVFMPAIVSGCLLKAQAFLRKSLLASPPR